MIFRILILTNYFFKIIEKRRLEMQNFADEISKVEIFTRRGFGGKKKSKTQIDEKSLFKQLIKRFVIFCKFLRSSTSAFSGINYIDSR